MKDKKQNDGKYAHKFDQGKPEFSLLVPSVLEEEVKVLTHGKEKYGAYSWQKVEGWRERYLSACLRHIFAWMDGIDNDAETGLSHLAHARCNLMFLMALHEKELLESADGFTSSPIEGLKQDIEDVECSGLQRIKDENGITYCQECSGECILKQYIGDVQGLM